MIKRLVLAVALALLCGITFAGNHLGTAVDAGMRAHAGHLARMVAEVDIAVDEDSADRDDSDSERGDMDRDDADWDRRRGFDDRNPENEDDETSRGDRREPIYDDGEDRAAFLDVLARATERFNWRVHAYCLMGNHYHLLIETRTAIWPRACASSTGYIPSTAIGAMVG